MKLVIARVLQRVELRSVAGAPGRPRWTERGDGAGQWRPGIAAENRHGARRRVTSTAASRVAPSLPLLSTIMHKIDFYSGTEDVAGIVA